MARQIKLYKGGELVNGAMTTKELYQQLLQMPDLHSLPEMDGEVLVWRLYKNAHVCAFCGGYDTWIEVVGTSASCPSMHWHPDEEDMLDELYSLGKKGNILVLKSFCLGGILGAGIFYMGDPNAYRFSPKRKWHWGKLTYLVQKEQPQT